MTIDELLKELGPLPTMMTAAEELKIIQKLATVPDELILRDFGRILPLLWDLFDSHTGSAIFEVDESNLGKFQIFAKRLLHLSTQMESSEDVERLKSISDAFSSKFSM